MWIVPVLQVVSKNRKGQSILLIVAVQPCKVQLEERTELKLES